jgi:hypothetical protein
MKTTSLQVWEGKKALKKCQGRKLSRRSNENEGNSDQDVDAIKNDNEGNSDQDVIKKKMKMI